MPEQRIISAAQAIAEATRDCMTEDSSIFVVGEGVADPKAIFGTTAGLIEQFGSERVIEMPISENGLTGVAIGAALMGRRPVMIYQRVEFALLAMEQLLNNAAKTHYVTNGQHKIPMVVRMVVGRGWGQGPAHSQCLETVFAHIPGLKVAMPATARDAKGMMVAALRDSNPVVFLEHRWFHYVTGDVPAELYEEPLSGAKVMRPGRDVTLVATSHALYEALLAAEVLEKFGISAEVVDLRVLRPLDPGEVANSVRRTGRLITMDTGWKTYGAGAEIVSEIVESCFSALKAPPKRIGLPDHPTPSTRSLAAAFYPSARDLVRAVAGQLDLPADQAGALEKAVEEAKPDIEADVPNPIFKGPF